MSRIAAIVLALAAAVHAQSQPTFRLIDVVPGLRNPFSMAVSSDGAVVAGSGNAIGTSDVVGWWWDSSQTQLVTPLPGYRGACVQALSADGRVAVGFCWPTNVGVLLAYRLELGGSPQPLPPLVSGEETQARGLDSSGTIACGSSGGSVVLWQNGIPVDLGIPAGWTAGGALDVSDGAAVVVGILWDEVSFLNGGFRWTPQGGFQELTGATTTECYGTSVSPDGSVITGSCHEPETPWRAARWYDDGAGQNLGILPGYIQSDAAGHSPDGRLVFGACWTQTDNHAFLYSDSIGMVDLQAFLISRGLDLQGRTLSVCRGITPDGSTLVGTAQSGAPTEAWIAHVPGLGCAADCDLSGSLNIRDFMCFINLFGRASRDADCNRDRALNAADFTCFLNRFAAGCS